MADSFLVIGLGLSGFSVVNFLSQQGLGQVVVFDTRKNPPMLDKLHDLYPDVPCYLEKLPHSVLAACTTAVVSPGVPLHHPVIERTRKLNKKIIGDIELFAKHAKAPVLAITGTNGKTTVTQWVSDMLRFAGYQVAMGGNIGIPALDLLSQKIPDYYVLELSSFQLSVTQSLRAYCAVVLNLSPDHLDYHGTYAAYKTAKRKIYEGCQHAIIHADQSECWQPVLKTAPSKCILFSKQPSTHGFHFMSQDNSRYLAYCGQPWLAVDELSLALRPMAVNALVVAAMGHALGVPKEAIKHSLQQFKGLPHRCQWVRTVNDVDYYNDSKATNMGACAAALRHMKTQYGRQVVLIAGGQAKGQDFSLIADEVARAVSHCIVFGQDAHQLQQAWSGATTIHSCNDLPQAIVMAQHHAQRSGCVLLSPACASFDSYSSFQERGEQFIKLCLALTDHA